MLLQSECRGVVFDTNMLAAIEQFGIDVFAQAKGRFGSEVKLLVPDSVLAELKALAEKGAKGRKAAAVAEAALQKSNVEVIEGKAGKADDALVELAREGYCIASSDKALRKRIKEFGGKIIYLRQKKLLALE